MRASSAEGSSFKQEERSLLTPLQRKLCDIFFGPQDMFEQSKEDFLSYFEEHEAGKFKVPFRILLSDYIDTLKAESDVNILVKKLHDMLFQMNEKRKYFLLYLYHKASSDAKIQSGIVRIPEPMRVGGPGLLYGYGDVHFRGRRGSILDQGYASRRNRCDYDQRIRDYYKLNSLADKMDVSDSGISDM